MQANVKKNSSFSWLQQTKQQPSCSERVGGGAWVTSRLMLVGGGSTQGEALKMVTVRIRQLLSESESFARGRARMLVCCVMFVCAVWCVYVCVYVLRCVLPEFSLFTSIECTCVRSEGTLVALDGLVDQHVALQFVLPVETGAALLTREWLLPCESQQTQNGDRVKASRPMNVK